MTKERKPPANAHKPTERTRGQVEALSGFGIKHDDIAALLGISDITLRKHYAAELAHGGAKMVAKVANSLLQKAVSDRPDAVNAAKFYLQARAGWSEKQEVKVTQSELSDEELDAEIMRRFDELGNQAPIGGTARGKGAPRLPQ